MRHRANRWIIVAAILAPELLIGCEGEFPTGSADIHAAEASYDLGILERSLHDIEAWHSMHNTGLAGSLRKRASASSIETAFSEDECRPNEELKALWSWHNGEESRIPFVWYHDFLSIEEARSEYERLRFNPLIRWDPKYIPLFTFEGEWYAVYCGLDGGRAGPIVHFYLEDEPKISYINLTTYLATMAEALNSGAVSWKNDAMVEDINEVYRIHQKYNKGAIFPYHVPVDAQQTHAVGPGEA